MTEGKSMLDAMASGLMEKSASPVPAARPLTPVAGEVKPSGPIPTVMPGATFPHDMPVEALSQAVLAIRHQMKYIEEALVAVEKAMGMEPAVVIKGESLPTPEQIADAKHAVVTSAMGPEVFADRFARLKDEAQAATYPPIVETELPELPVTNVDGWVCPEHGTSRPDQSPKGRKFNRCPVAGCKQFEK